jgi:hypothetical protein
VVAPLDDTRVTGKAGVTTKLVENISIRFAFGLRFDHAPAPLAAVSGLPFDPAYAPLSEPLDTTTELAVIINFI